MRERGREQKDKKFERGGREGERGEREREGGRERGRIVNFRKPFGRNDGRELFTH